MQPDKSHVARWYERLSGCHYGTTHLCTVLPVLDLATPSHLNVVLVG